MDRFQERAEERFNQAMELLKEKPDFTLDEVYVEPDQLEYPATADEAFQATGHDSYIKGNLVLRARKNEIAEPLGPLVIGVDPSRFGDDLFAIVWRQGRKILKKQTIDKIDIVQGANKIKQIIDQDDPAKVFVDAGGLGAGIYDLLCSFGEKYDRIVSGVNFGGEPLEPVITLDDGSKCPGPSRRNVDALQRMAGGSAGRGYS